MPLIRDAEPETLAKGRPRRSGRKKITAPLLVGCAGLPALPITPPSILSRMFGFKPKNPEEHRYYLLPGQGRGAKRKRRVHMIASLVTAALVAAGLSALMWYVNENR